MPRHARTPTVAVTLAVLVVASGCTALPLNAEASPTPPTEDVEEQFDGLETLRATEVSTLTTVNGTGGSEPASDGAADDDTTRSRSRIRVDFTGPRRQYSRQLAPGESEGDRVLVNGSVTLVYDASENEATRIPRVDAMPAQDRASYLARVVEAARSGGAVVEPAGGVSPLPVVPATSSKPSVPTHEIEGYQVEYLGTRSIADRTAHGFRMTAISEAAMDLNQTMWLDGEFYYPLRTNQTLDFGNRTMRVTTRLVNVTFNGALSENAFRVDLPENATFDTTELPETEAYDSRRALAADVDTSVPDPAVPRGYAFERATHVGGNTSQVSLRYTDGDGRLVVSKVERAAGGNGSRASAGENVTVAGHDGRYLTTASSSLVTWSCDGHAYSVVATTLDRDAILDVAASVARE